MSELSSEQKAYRAARYAEYREFMNGQYVQGIGRKAAVLAWKAHEGKLPVSPHDALAERVSVLEAGIVRLASNVKTLDDALGMISERLDRMEASRVRASAIATDVRGRPLPVQQRLQGYPLASRDRRAVEDGT